MTGPSEDPSEGETFYRMFPGLDRTLDPAPAPLAPPNPPRGRAGRLDLLKASLRSLDLFPRIFLSSELSRQAAQTGILSGRRCE